MLLLSKVLRLSLDQNLPFPSHPVKIMMTSTKKEAIIHN